MARTNRARPVNLTAFLMEVPDEAPVDLATSIGPALPLASPIIGTVACHGPSGGGSGAPSAAPLLELARSVSAAVITPSVTNNARRGHPRPRVAGFDGGVTCAEGCPNYGLDWYCDPTTIDKVGGTASNIPYVVSIAINKVFEAEASTDTVLSMLGRAMSADGVDGVVLDLSCSADIGGKAKAVACDFDAMEAVLAAAAAAGSTKPLGVRLPPYLYADELRRATRILNIHLPRERSSFVVVAGSIFGLVVDNEVRATATRQPQSHIARRPAYPVSLPPPTTQTEMPLIKPCGGLGGVRGAAVAPMVLESVHSFRQALRSDVAVVASLACETGADVFAALLAGACAVQVDAPPPESLAESGLRELLAQLAEELADIIDEKG